mgnify:CR=1 FL=1
MINMINRTVKNSNRQKNKAKESVGNFIKMCFFRVRFFLKRIWIAMVSLVLIALFGFILIKLMPGNPVDTYAQQLMMERGMKYEEARKLAVTLLNYDPNKSIFEQLSYYVKSLLRFNLGTSMRRPDVSVNLLIKQFLPWTLFISSIALVISFIVGIFLGSSIAWKRNSLMEGAISSYIIVSSSIPDYLWGIILVFIFGVKFKVFPVQGNYDILLELEGWPWLLNVLYHAALPIVAYSIVQIGGWALAMRGSCIGVLGEDYIYAAKARGIPEKIIVKRYLRRNAMLPLITSLAMSLAALFGGSPLIETIFNYPGIGQQFGISIASRDYFIIQGLTLFMSFIVIIANMIADSLYSVIDPRVRRDV